MPQIEVAQGSVKSMPLPEGWKEFEIPDQGFALYSVRDFRPANAATDETSISLYSRGRRLGEATAAGVQNVFSQKPHHLSAREIDQLIDVLSEAGDPEVFSILDARTEELDGRKIMVLEGRYIQSQTKMIRLYIDTNGDGAFVEEIIFSAPSDDYEKNIKAVKACFQEIKWK